MLNEFSLRGARRERPRRAAALVGRIGPGEGFALEERTLLAAVVLTGRLWTLTSADQAGTDWSKSTLVFTSQVPQSATVTKVEGYFDWQSEGTPRRLRNDLKRRGPGWH